MLKEKNYDFCKRMLEVHKKDRRDKTRTPEKNEFEFKNTVGIFMPVNAGEIIVTAAKDFADYLFTSMNVIAYVAYDDGKLHDNSVKLSVNKDLRDASEQRGHRVDVRDNCVIVEGYDDAGVMTALFYLEDVMNLRQAPFLKKGVETRRLMFEKRVVASGYGVDEYPDAYLANLAHHGFNQLRFDIKGPNESVKGYCNFKDIAARASRYGFDIMIVSNAKHDVYPEGDEAQAFYDHMYGDLFAEFPFISSIALLAEVIGFPSRDPSMPKDKKGPGYWPCNDWHLLIRMIRKAVDKAKPGVDITLISYNWGFCDVKKREELVASLPKDVILRSGWEMFEYYDLDGVCESIHDYSLRMADAGQYFYSEAKLAVKYGLRLDAITNMGGKTWDFGAIPFDPAPYRWAERCEAIRKAHDECNLSRLCDSIHYGVYPSFISELSKWAFCEPRVDLEELIPKLLAMHFGNEQVDELCSAMRKWSEAFANMVPTNEDQYGALRIGPAYPLYSGLEPGGGEAPPQDKFAFHKLVFGMYHNTYFYVSRGDAGEVRIPKEIKAYEYVKKCIDEGLAILDGIKVKNDELLRLINMGRFMSNTIVTVLHTKNFFILDEAKKVCEDKQELAKIIHDMVEILEDERQNAIDTIPISEFDSILGFEPSMEYVTDKRRLLWKINQVENEIEKLKSQL